MMTEKYEKFYLILCIYRFVILYEHKLRFFSLTYRKSVKNALRQQKLWLTSNHSSFNEVQ